MSTRSSILKLAAFVAVAGVSFLPAGAEAQSSNIGQVVQAVAKLNQAQLAFVKKLADDPNFAKQFDAATSSGNYDAAASLAAAATGIAKSSIHVGPRGSSGDDHDASGTGSSTGTMNIGTTVFHLASRDARTGARKSALTTGTVCIDLGWVRGCISWA